MKYLITFMVLLFAGAAMAQHKSKYNFLKQDSKIKTYVTKLALPVSLISVGVFGFNRGEEPNAFNSPAKFVFNETLEGRHIHVDDFLQYTPLLAYLSISGRENFGERFMVTTTASLLVWGLIMPVKAKAGELRPDFQSDNSFPSGHTATAFMGAELLRLGGYGKKITIPAYLTAVTVGCLRIHNNRHWFNDVVAGAGFGILSAELAYWLFPLEKKLFSPKDKTRKLSNKTF